ncbi:carbohydrate ABC transporter membrane protein 2, CUT1 family [Sanguibacter gelidistatuariae]|uniref:Carbohydrate ABC transporter membrane protein 2, CUT1 family n=1 Tax=Sanguibacter gelidistatuariae TaxID=1814289 RepID=A0A1G6HVB9_9MICO|nr:carbohydrate ABC transporter permease [Sanguibacter gelidistatuariae]SDB98083.1 carbohydrate ABC transporter membrane protein 2, CUT1 family [Sanguibacter gelidistatuariae]
MTTTQTPVSAPGARPDVTSLPRRIRSNRSVMHYVGSVLKALMCALMLAFFALPLLWLATAPFDSAPSLSLAWPEWTLKNFKVLIDNPYALRSLANSIILALGVTVIVLVFGSIASYALSRVRIPGRDTLLYALLLLSSIVTGTAAMVPTFQLMNQLGLIDSQLGVILVMAAGVMPTVIFILKDFMDSVPRSYEESARLAGAGPLRILIDVVVPIARPGLATIAVWAVVQVWGNFLIPYILLRSPDKQPAAVVMYTFYTEGGQPNLALISTFSLLFSVPVVAMYFFVNRKFGFRFHGGIKS